MKLNNKLLKKLSIGVASLALVAPLVLGGMQSSPVHADYQSHDATARYFEKADSRIPKSEKEHDRKLGARADASEQRYEQNMIKRDPLATGMYAFEPDNSAKTKALIRETLIKHPKLFAKDTNMLKKYHVKYRHARRSNHRRARKHVKYGTVIDKRGDEEMPTADQEYQYMMEHDKSYRDAENHDTYEQNMSAIEEMPSNPGVAQSILVDKSNGSKVNPRVLRFARYWKYVDEMDGAYNSPDGDPNPKYANHKYTYKRMPKSLKAVDHYVRTNKRYRAVMRHLDKVTVGQELYDMPNGDPTIIQGYISDAEKGLHVNSKVLAKAKYWKHREQADGQWYNPSAVPNKRYAWGRNLKHGRRNHAKKHVTKHHYTRKRTNKKHNHHKSRKATNKDR